MTVKDLKEKLEQYEEDAVVYIPFDYRDHPYDVSKAMDVLPIFSDEKKSVLIC